jgi:hypothetical protein
MNSKYLPIWQQAKPLLKEIQKKNYLIHTQAVARAMEEIIAGEGGDPDLLIPAALLHDIGWVKVSLDLQLAKDPDNEHQAQVEHIKQAPPLIRKILKPFNYSIDQIERIVDIVTAHKFQEPMEDKEKQMLIDADNLSDIYKESFYSDIQSYHTTLRKQYYFRSQNTFYTPTAKKIFQNQLADRLKEIEQSETGQTRS